MFVNRTVWLRALKISILIDSLVRKPDPTAGSSYPTTKDHRSQVLQVKTQHRKINKHLNIF